MGQWILPLVVCWRTFSSMISNSVPKRLFNSVPITITMIEWQAHSFRLIENQRLQQHCNRIQSCCPSCILLSNNLAICHYYLLNLVFVLNTWIPALRWQFGVAAFLKRDKCATHSEAVQCNSNTYSDIRMESPSSENTLVFIRSFCLRCCTVRQVKNYWHIDILRYFRLLNYLKKLLFF